jgi:hypothetical protein
MTDDQFRFLSGDEEMEGWEDDGGFQLSPAIIPMPDSLWRPREAYRSGIHRVGNRKVPTLAATISAERILPVFLDLVAPMGPSVDVVLETGHGSREGKHRDLAREGIDLTVLSSHLLDFEDYLLADGLTGLVVCSQADRPLQEVQLDEHKVLVVYAYDLRPFIEVMNRHGIREEREMMLILEDEHAHRSRPEHPSMFQTLATRLSMSEAAETAGS